MIACRPSSREPEVRHDIPFTNACHISNDHPEQIALPPCPALGRRYVAAYPRKHCYMVKFVDSVFQTNEDSLLTNVRLLPSRTPSRAGLGFSHNG